MMSLYNSTQYTTPRQRRLLGNLLLNSTILQVTHTQSVDQSTTVLTKRLAQIFFCVRIVNMPNTVNDVNSVQWRIQDLVVVGDKPFSLFPTFVPSGALPPSPWNPDSGVWVSKWRGIFTGKNCRMPVGKDASPLSPPGPATDSVDPFQAHLWPHQRSVTSRSFRACHYYWYPLKIMFHSNKKEHNQWVRIYTVKHSSAVTMLVNMWSQRHLACKKYLLHEGLVFEDTANSAKPG